MIPPDYQTRANGRAKVAVLWGVFAFVAAQVILGFVAGWLHPELRDPEYGYRLTALCNHVAANPDRPLLLILGSSRTLSGICPPALPPWPEEAGSEPCVFNFSLLGAGPVRELMTLRRLLAAGHRPDFLLVEVWPPYLPQQGYWLDEHHIMARDLRWVDLPVVARYFTDRPKALGKLALEGMVPVTGLRSNLLAHSAAGLLSPDQGWRAKAYRDLQEVEPTGWHPWLEHGSEAEFRTRIEGVKVQTKPCLDHFFVSDTADRALRELLEECRRARIKAALILMPEHSELRSWYTPAVHEHLHAYLSRLRGDYAVSIFDTRDWVQDGGFHDLTHMAPPAAAPYTRRLGREVLLPWLAARR